MAWLRRRRCGWSRLLAFLGSPLPGFKISMQALRGGAYSFQETKMAKAKKEKKISRLRAPIAGRCW